MMSRDLFRPFQVTLRQKLYSCERWSDTAERVQNCRVGCERFSNNSQDGAGGNGCVEALWQRATLGGLATMQAGM
jgi:hypothetical protein